MLHSIETILYVKLGLLVDLIKPYFLYNNNINYVIKNSKFKTSCNYTQDFRKKACKHSYLTVRTKGHQVQSGMKKNHVAKGFFFRLAYKSLRLESSKQGRQLFPILNSSMKRLLVCTELTGWTLFLEILEDIPLTFYI